MEIIILYIYMGICTGIAIHISTVGTNKWYTVLNGVFWFVPITIVLLLRLFED